MRSKIPTSVMIVLLIVSIIPVLAVEGGTGDADLTANVTDLPPVADAGGPYYGRPGRSISFDGTHSYDPDGEIESYAWDFGDGGTATGPTPSHTYDSTGTYIVTLTVTDNHELTGIDTTTVYVRRPPPPPPINMKPKADAGPNMKISVGSTLHFSGVGSYDPDGMIVSYRWKFGDGTTAIGVEVSHTYTEPGHYNMTLTVKDNRGAEDFDKCEVFAWKPPVPVADKFGDLVPGEQRGFKVNALKETNTTVTLNTTNQVTVTILKYDGNPHPLDPIPATTIQIYVDVEVSNPDAVIWPIYVEMHYADEEVEGLNKSSLGIYYWFNETWQRCSDTGVDTERNVVWAYMTAEEASGSPILIGGITLPKPAEFKVTDIVITPEEIELGDEVTISVLVSNIGEETGIYTVTLGMENGLIGILSEEEVTLEGGESRMVPFTFTMNNEGIYTVTVDGLTGSFTVKVPPKPAEFVLSELEALGRQAMIHDDEGRPIVEGEYVIFTVLVINIGETEGNHTVEFKVDGETIDTYNWTLLAGRGHRALVYYEALNAGTYQVSVGNLTDTFTVRAPLEPAEFVFSNLQITPRVKIGMSVNISVDVTNVGEMMGFCTFDLKVNGRVVDSVEIPSFVGGVTDTQLFELMKGEGTYDVEVNGLTGSFTVFTTPDPPFWTSPVFVMVVSVIIAAAVILYANWKGMLPFLSPEIDTMRSNGNEKGIDWRNKI